MQEINSVMKQTAECPKKESALFYNLIVKFLAMIRKVMRPTKKKTKPSLNYILHFNPNVTSRR